MSENKKTGIKKKAFLFTGVILLIILILGIIFTRNKDIQKKNLIQNPSSYRLITSLPPDAGTGGSLDFNERVDKLSFNVNNDNFIYVFGRKIYCEDKKDIYCTGDRHAYEEFYIVTNKNKKIRKLPCVGTPIISNDAKHYACLKQTVQGLYEIYIDGKEKNYFSKLQNLGFCDFTDFFFTPYSNKFVFIAKKCNGIGKAVVVDGEVSETYDGVSFLQSSPNGQYIGFVGEKSDKVFLVINGKKIDLNTIKEDYPSSIPSIENVYGFIINSFGEWVIIGRMKECPDYLNCEVVLTSSNKVIGPYSAISYLTYSPSGKHFAYLFHMITNKLSKYFLGIDGSTQYEIETKSEYIAITEAEATLTFSPNDEHLVLIYSTDLKGALETERIVYLDGKKIASYYVDWNSIKEYPMKSIFSPDSQKIAFVFGKGGICEFCGGSFMPNKFFVKLWDLKGNEIFQSSLYENIYTIDFTKDSNQLIYTTLENNEIFKYDYKIQE